MSVCVCVRVFSKECSKAKQWSHHYRTSGGTIYFSQFLLKGWRLLLFFAQSIHFSLCRSLSVTCLYGSCSTFLLSHLLHLLVINPNDGNDWERNGGTKRPPHSTTSKVLPSFLSTISCLDFGCCRTFFLLLLLLLCHFLCKIQLLRNRSKDPTRSMQKYKATSFTRSLSNLNRFTPVSRTCLLGFLLPESGLDLRRSFFLLFFESL